MRASDDLSWRSSLYWDDAFRWRADGRAQIGYREWHHFCVVTERLDFLINFSVVSGAGPRPPVAHVTVLARHDRWDGAVERVAMGEVDIRAGHLSASFSESRVDYDGDYHVRLVLPAKRITVETRLRPMARPFIAHNVDPTGTSALSWLVVPRLAATGKLTIDGSTWSFRDAPAYHDHNWGQWGESRVWDWGFGLTDGAGPETSVVFVRLSNCARTEVHVQGLFLWDGSALRRVVRDADLDFRRRGDLVVPHIFKVPPALGLLAPGGDTGAPRELEIAYDDAEERGAVRFLAENAAQVLAPGERYPELFIINEVSGRFEIEGTVSDRVIRAAGRGFVEHVTA